MSSTGPASHLSADVNVEKRKHRTKQKQLILVFQESMQGRRYLYEYTEKEVIYGPSMEGGTSARKFWIKLPTSCSAHRLSIYQRLKVRISTLN